LQIPWGPDPASGNSTSQFRVGVRAMGEIPNSAGRAPATAIAPASDHSSASWAAAIVDSCSEAIFSTSVDGQIVGLNPAAEQLSGYAADEIIGHEWQILIPPEDVKEIARAAPRLRNGEKTVRIETHLRRQGGVNIKSLLSMSAVRDRAGTLLGFSAMFRDITEDKLAESKLRQSEEKFKTVFKYSSDAISIGSLSDGKYLDINDEFCRMMGLPPEKIIGRTPVQLGIVTEEQQQAFINVLRLSGTLRNHEITLTDRDGNAHRLLVSAEVVELDGNQCALGFIKDISDLKHAENELLRTERQLNDVLANAPLAVVAMDTNRAITAARGRALAALPVGQLVGQNFGELLLPTNPALANIARALAGETFSATETVMRGQMSFEVWYSPVWDSQHRVTGATAVATDITARKRAEDELRRSEEYYRSLVETSADLTAVSNDQGVILFAAGEGRKDFGYELSDFIGHRAMEFIHPAKHEEQARLIAESFAHPTVIGRGEAPIKCRDGSWLDCELIGRAAIAPDGKRILVSTVRNISERKRAELEIAESRDQALAASRAKSEFLSSMSHEIRTPMNAILGMADLMWESDLSGEQRRYLDTVINNGNALLELINSILDLAKVESGRLSLEALDFDLRELLEKVADTLAVRADEKGVDLAVHIDDDVPTALVGDPLRLRQVLTNLLGNAIKFTEKGIVVIRVVRNPRADKPGALLISVTDSGIGIPAEKVPKLFDPFSQADSSVTRKYGGTGLGLAIVDRLVRLMGGTISVDSEPGRGSTFSFTSEFEVVEVSASAAVAPNSSLDLRGVRVLVVDDNQVNRTIVRETLVPCGAIVIEAASGFEGIERFRHARQSGRPFRLLISDHMMPEMDGFEMVRRIRAMAPAGDLTIMMLSSTDLPQTLAKVRALGIGWYVVKPVKRAELYTAISRAMAESVPLQPPVPSHPRTSDGQEAVVERPLRILLADDSADNRLLIKAYLRRTPYHLEETDDGAKAIELVFGGGYDLILMDIQMPVMDGYTAVRKIREWEEHTHRARTPIIALTASALDDAVRMTRQSGFDLHVSKPVKRGTLLNAIEKTCVTVDSVIESPLGAWRL
jgi:two-component system sensor histidine kinase/response regulator